MKTFVVIGIYNDDSKPHYVTNAESFREAASYAIVRAEIVAPAYLVWDHDLNHEIVKREELFKDDVAALRPEEAVSQPS